MIENVGAACKPTPLNVNHDNDRFSMFNKKRDIPWVASIWS